MTLTLAEVLQHPRLGITVLVDAGTELTVRWVHATEQADPTPYLRGGEIVLTDGLWLDTAQTAQEYVRRLRAIDVAALGYGPMPENPEVPQCLVEACAEQRLTLFAMPPTLPFMAVSEVFVDRFAQDREAALSANVARNARYLEAARSGAGADGLLRLLQEELGAPAWIASLHGRVLFCGDYEPNDADRATVAAALHRARREPVTSRGWRVQVITAPDVPRGYLVVRAEALTTDEISPGSVGHDVADQILPFLGMELAHRRALSQGQRRFAGELVGLVLAGETAQVTARLAAAGFGDGQPIAVLVCTPVAGRETTRPAEPETGDEAVEEVETALTAAGLRCLAAAYDGEVVVLVPWERPPAELPELGRLLRSDVGVVVGLGSLARTAAALHTGLIEARHAARLAAARHNGLGYDTYAGLGTHQLLLDLQPADVLSTFAGALLDPIRDHDRRHHSELVQTITRFLELDGRWQETADDLHVHVNTLRNRLTRVEALLGRSLQSTATRVDLYLALRAADGR